MRASLLGATFLALAVTACADDSKPEDNDDVVDPGQDEQQDDGPDGTDDVDPPTPDESARDTDELAAILGAHIRGEFPVMLAAAEVSESRAPNGFVLNGDGTGSGVYGGLNLTFSYFCNDGSTAHTVVPCDGLAHHSHIKLTIAGSNTVDSMAMDGISRTVDWEIRDLTVDKARFRGPDNVAVSTSITGADGRVATYNLNFDATYEQVRFMPGALFPTFGTIDFGVNVERVRDADRRVFDTTAQLVYGSSGVPTTLTFADGAAFSIDLQTGAVVKL